MYELLITSLCMVVAWCCGFLIATLLHIKNIKKITYQFELYKKSTKDLEKFVEKFMEPSFLKDKNNERSN